jgi:hypothetical protein
VSYPTHRVPLSSAARIRGNTSIPKPVVQTPRDPLDRLVDVLGNIAERLESRPHAERERTSKPERHAA